MHFWKDKELALRLKKGKVTEKEKFCYFLGVFLMFALLSILNTYISMSARAEYSDLFATIGYWAICVVGTITCYQTNMEGDKAKFIERIISLSFPINIRLAVYTLILWICGVIVMVGYVAINNIDDEAKIQGILSHGTYISIALLIVYYYYRLNNAIKAASSKK